MTDEPLDTVVFSDGLVRPGEVVTATAAITDYTPQDEFFLLQRRESPIAFLAPAARVGRPRHPQSVTIAAHHPWQLDAAGMSGDANA